MSKVPHWEGDRHGAKEVIIDPEFGAFGDNGCIDFLKTDFDKDLDSASLLPSKLIWAALWQHTKMTSCKF